MCPDSSAHTYLPFENISAARILAAVTHPTLGESWFELGPASDISLRLSRETQQTKDRLHGINYTVKERMRSVEAVLSGKLVENCSPDVTKYLFGQGSTQLGNANTIEVTRESFRLYGTEKYILPHAAGIAASVGGPNIAASSALFGTGSTIPAGNNAYAVVAWYDAAETVGSYPSVDDVDWMNFTIAAAPNSEYIGLSWTAPASVTPDHYTVYVQAGVATFDPANAAVKLLETTGLSCVIASHTSLGNKTFGAAAAATYSLVDEAGTAFTITDDYLFDTTTGEVSAVSTGTVADGELLTLTYSRYKSADIRTPIGAGVARPTYVKLKIIQLEEGDDGYETGCEVTLYKVNMLSGDASLSFPQEPAAGMDFSWNCLLDRTYNQIGLKVDRDPALQTYTIKT